MSFSSVLCLLKPTGLLFPLRPRRKVPLMVMVSASDSFFHQDMSHLDRHASESVGAQSCPTLCDPVDCSLPGFSIHGIFQDTGVGCHFLLQGIFLTQGLNPGLLHCRQTLYHLSHQGNSEGVANALYQHLGGSSYLKVNLTVTHLMEVVNRNDS